MVDALGDPPTSWDTAPAVLAVPAGTAFVRLHDPLLSASNPHPVSDPSEHRTAGPYHRFNHQIPAEPDRGIAYGAKLLSGALAEVYGSSRVIDRLATMHVGFFAPQRDVELIDLRGQGSLAVGATAELMTTPDRDLSQRWARWLYQRYEWACGVAFVGRYAGCLCAAMWERAPLERRSPSLPLATPRIFSLVELWADRYGFIIDR